MNNKKNTTMHPFIILLVALQLCTASYAFGQAANNNRKPNILLIIADDLSKTLPLYGDSTITTPGMDAVAKDGVVFERAYCTASSCTPSRASILTGKYPHQLAEGGNLHGFLPPEHENYTRILAENGYRVGLQGKGWGPGNYSAGGYTDNPAGKSYQNFETFMEDQPADVPFCFWIGSHDPHRPYSPELRERLGINSLKVKVPAWLPDDRLVHSDFLDYYAESKRFDQTVEKAIALLKEKGIYEQTLIVITSDNGMPFPRVKANAYDMSTNIPLIIGWGGNFMKGNRLEELVSLVDLAPTFLSAAGLEVPKSMVGQSLLDLLKTGESTQQRAAVFSERERHAYVRAGNLGYPMRAIRTDRFLYINNLRPDRWPAGDPENTESNRFFGDIDDGPTKQLLLKNENDPTYEKFRLWSLDKRPAEELYDLEKDPDQLKNLAKDPSYDKIRRELAERLMEWRKSTKDTVTETSEPFDNYPFYGEIPNRL
ncbi:sulfatase [Olivibacter sp. SDN3]|uniref:sulfatase family protein n=1 Tax=Olivibacter sp. SDN3 TaxID=2764720 RepID=UPI0016515598|nr:sulfatase [Olivibacter sp. SDN3]QNL47864.1 sulfatase [Olivibacter sp. SDN3]